MSDDIDTITDAANSIEQRLNPETVARLITWRDTELGHFEEENVKALGRHVI